jgi:site-specific DNA recombinase
VCTNRQVRINLLEETVWREVCDLLRDPQRIEQEYRCRLQEPSPNQELLARVEAEIARWQQAMDRLMDGYTEGYIDKPAFTARRERSRERLARLTAEAQGLREEVHSQVELQRLVHGLPARITTVMRSGAERMCSRQSSEAEGNRGEADMNNQKRGKTVERTVPSGSLLVRRDIAAQAVAN